MNHTTNRNVMMDIKNANENKVTTEQNTSDVLNSNDTNVDITNNNPISNNDSYNHISNDTRGNLFLSNNENQRSVVMDQNTSNAVSSIQNESNTRVNLMNNNMVSNNSYNQNSNDEITNLRTSNMDNRGCNSVNRKPERTFSSDTIGSMTYDSDIVVSDNDNVSVVNIQVPIVGYEVMEERARFTVFKLKVDDLKSDRSWLVFRRYTDFVRLYTRLKSENVNINLPLPGKRWFRDNFETAFLEERVRGLQVFINTVIRRLGNNKTVREFLCVEEPPGTWGWQAEALAGALQDTVSSLRRELRQSVQREENLVKEIERLREKCADCTLCNRRNS